MIYRKLSEIALRQLKIFPAIAILGPRQVGKTTLAQALMKWQKKKVHYIDLEKRSQFNLLQLDPENYLAAYRNDCVIIDEIQRMPELFPMLRAIIDEKRKPGRFIITGSASPDLLKGASESLAGRISYNYLYPIFLSELPPRISLNQLWLKGGFPPALTMRANKDREYWMDSFITTYIEKDLPFLFDVKFSSHVMRKLWQMLAHVQGAVLNTENLGRSLDVTGTTLKRYLDYLEAAFLIKRLPAFYVNIGKRLVKSPKIYILDTGILHFLLSIHTEKELLNSLHLGASWEGFVISQIYYAKNARIDAYYYRTHAGAECDLVLARGHEVKACIEIKYSNNPVLGKGFYQSLEDLKPKHAFIIVPASVDYLTKDKKRIVGMAIFINKYLPKIS